MLISGLHKRLVLNVKWLKVFVRLYQEFIIKAANSDDSDFLFQYLGVLISWQ